LLAERGALLDNADLLEFQIFHEVTCGDLGLLVRVEGELIVIRVLRPIAEFGSVGVSRLDYTLGVVVASEDSACDVPVGPAK
jgi:hypothetical protein